jgi:hypothetical protein
MFRILCDPSSGSTELCLIEITRGDSQIFCRVLVGVWQRNFKPVVGLCVHVTAGWPAGRNVHTHTTGSKLRCHTPTKHTTKHL